MSSDDNLLDDEMMKSVFVDGASKLRKLKASCQSS